MGGHNKFELDDEPRAKRITFGWCSPECSPREGLAVLATGCDVAIRLTDGRCYVGRPLALRERELIFRPWSAPRPMRFRRSAILSACPLGRHSYAERQHVRAIQRRGEPAVTLEPARVPTPEQWAEEREAARARARKQWEARTAERRAVRDARRSAKDPLSLAADRARMAKARAALALKRAAAREAQAPEDEGDASEAAE